VQTVEYGSSESQDCAQCYREAAIVLPLEVEVYGLRPGQVSRRSGLVEVKDATAGLAEDGSDSP